MYGSDRPQQAGDDRLLAGRGAGLGDLQAAGHLGSGRSVTPEIEAPKTLANRLQTFCASTSHIRKSFAKSMERMRGGAKRPSPCGDPAVAVDRAPIVAALGDCPGRKPPFLAVQRLARPYKNAMQN